MYGFCQWRYKGFKKYLRKSESDITFAFLCILCYNLEHIKRDNIKRRKIMFTDYTKIIIKAGNGGNGAISFRRENM